MWDALAHSGACLFPFAVIVWKTCWPLGIFRDADCQIRYDRGAGCTSGIKSRYKQKRCCLLKRQIFFNDVIWFTNCWSRLAAGKRESKPTSRYTVTRERFKNTYELLNLRSHKFSPVNKMHIFQCMGKILCVEFQRYTLKFHTKYITHTLKDMVYIQHWNSKSS